MILGDVWEELVYVEGLVKLRDIRNIDDFAFKNKNLKGC